METFNPKKPISIIVGLGKSGIGAAKLLNSEGVQVIVFEQSEENLFNRISQKLTNQGIVIKHSTKLELPSFNKWLPYISSVVIGPGIPWDHKTLNLLREKGINVESEISIAWERLNHIPWIGITGTNGKTTVTHMLEHILKENHIYTLMGGNIGISASEIALSCNKESDANPKYLVMELSSYQLETSSKITPFIGIWTTFTPDHLERHKSLDAYFNIKRKLLDNSSFRIYNQDDEYLYRQRLNLKQGIWVSSKGPGKKDFPATFWINSKGKVFERENEILDTSVMKVEGRHNLQNLLLVRAAARRIGLSGTQIENGFKSFKGVEHRLEKIGFIQEISIFNDSKATNYDAAKIGLSAMKSPSIVIAGGQIKIGDANDWLKELKQKAKAVMIFGESKNELYELIQKNGFKGIVNCFSNLEDATDAAIKIGLKLKVKSILLSPACASFDQYQNFEARGNHFKQIVKPFLNPV